MTAVWYNKPGDRTITAAQWTAAGITGSPTDTVWNAANGWSVPAASLTGPQITLLAADVGFNTTAADGPNTGRTASGLPSGDVIATQAYVDAKAAAGATYGSSSPISKLLSNVLNPLRRQHFRSGRSTGPVTTDITSFASTSTADATLTRSYSTSPTGLTNGQLRLMTANEIAALPYDPGQGRQNLLNSAGTGYVSSYVSSNNIDGAATFPFIPQRTIRFMTDSDKVDVLAYAPSGVTGQTFMLYIDGVPAMLAPQQLNAIAQYIHLIFPSAKTRYVEIKTDMFIANITCKPLYRVWRAQPLKGPRMLVVGASYAQPVVWNGSSGVADNFMKGMWQQIGEFIDLEDVWVEGIAGTGFLTRGSVSSVGYPNNNYLDRVAGHITCNPEIIVFDTSFSNDALFGNSAAAIAAQAHSYFQTLRQSLPNAKCILLDGIRTTTYGDYTSTFATVISNLQALRQDLYYIASGQYLDMAGYTPGHTTGTGNTDVYIGNDGIHPTVEGHSYLRTRLAPIIQRIIQDDGRLLNTVQS